MMNNMEDMNVNIDSLQNIDELKAIQDQIKNTVEKKLNEIKNLNTSEELLKILTLNDFWKMTFYDNPHEYIAIKLGVVPSNEVLSDSAYVMASENVYHIGNVLEWFSKQEGINIVNFEDTPLDSYMAISDPKLQGRPEFKKPLWAYAYEELNPKAIQLFLLNLLNVNTWEWSLYDVFQVLADIKKQLERHFRIWSDLYGNKYHVHGEDLIPAARAIFGSNTWTQTILNIAQKYNYKIEEVKVMEIWKIFEILRAEGQYNKAMFVQQKSKVVNKR